MLAPQRVPSLSDQGAHQIMFNPIVSLFDHDIIPRILFTNHLADGTPTQPPRSPPPPPPRQIPPVPPCLCSPVIASYPMCHASFTVYHALICLLHQPVTAPCNPACAQGPLLMALTDVPPRRPRGIYPATHSCLCGCPRCMQVLNGCLTSHSDW